MKPTIYRSHKLKLKAKICEEHGCGKEFFGLPRAKYCDIHRDPEMRHKNRIRYTYEGRRIIKTNFHNIEWADLTCAVPGCCNTFRVLLRKGQENYPDFCEIHRNEYKRKRFLNMVMGAI